MKPFRPLMALVLFGSACLVRSADAQLLRLEVLSRAPMAQPQGQAAGAAVRDRAQAHLVSRLGDSGH